MAVNCHMKDGILVVVANGDNFKPWPGDENFVQILDANAGIVGIVPVDSVDVIERA